MVQINKTPQLANMRSDVCGNCKFRRLIGRGPTVSVAYECLRYPPTLQAFVIGIDKSTGEPQFHYSSQYPIVTPGQWCGEWKAGIEAATSLAGVEDELGTAKFRA